MRRTRRAGMQMRWVWACGAVFAASPLAYADKVSVDLGLVAPGTTNKMTSTITATLAVGTRSNTQPTTVSGNVLADLGIAFDPFSGAASSVDTIEFTGGQVNLSNTTYTLDWGLFIGKVVINTSNMAGTPDTPNPPGVVSNGMFNAADHVIIFNQGSFKATGTGLIIAPMLPTNPYIVDLAQEPMPASSTDQGTLTVSAPAISNGVATYNVRMLLPMKLENAVYEDPTGLATITASGSGTAEATAQFSRAMPEWIVDGGGQWNAPGNWTGNTVPDAPGALARFLGKLTPSGAPATVSLDGPRTVGTIAFDNASAYTIVAGTGGSLKLDNAGSGAIVAVAHGSHRIDAPVALADRAVFDIADAAKLQMTAGVQVADGQGLVKRNAGTLTVRGGVTLGAGSYAEVQAGTLDIDGISGGTLRIGGAGVVSLARHLPVAPACVLQGLELGGTTDAWEGKLDLGEGSLLIQATAETAGDVLARTINQIRSARGPSAAWTGPGIGSSAAIDDANTGLGVAQRGSDVLVKHTWNGDADLNGRIDADDYFHLDRGLLADGTDWEHGDFNYDGKVDADDFTLIDNAYLAQRSGSMEAAAAPTPVPEPAAISCVIGGVLMLMRRKRMTARGQ